MDLFRDRSPDLWPRLSLTEQAKVVQRLGMWNVLRHRMSSAAARTLVDAVACVSTQVTSCRSPARVGRSSWPCSVAGSIRCCTGSDSCTGPPFDIAATDDPLLRHLLDAGLATVGSHRLGLAVDGCGTLLDRSGRPVGGLTVLGALRKGTVFETTAIPELRMQASALADALVRSDAWEASHALRWST